MNKIKTSFTACVLLIAVVVLLVCICRDHKPVDNVHEGSHFSELMRTVSGIETLLDCPESHMRIWCNNLVDMTIALGEDSEKKHVVTLFANAVRTIKPLSYPPERWTTTLWNYRSAVEACGHLLGLVDNWEDAFALLHESIVAYRAAILRCEILKQHIEESQIRKKIESTQRQLRVDLQNFSIVVNRSYLPLVARRKLPQDRYRYWKMRIEAVLNENDIALKDVVPGGGTNTQTRSQKGNSQ